MAFPANRPKWAKNIHPMTNEEFDKFGVDEDGDVTWDGKTINTTHRLKLGILQTASAIVLGIFAIVGSLGSFGQGYVALYQAKVLFCVSH